MHSKLFKEYTEKERCRLRNACMVKALDEQVAGKGDAKYRKRIEEIEERRLNAIKCTEIDELEKKKASEKLEKQKTLALDLQVGHFDVLWMQCIQIHLIKTLILQKETMRAKVFINGRIHGQRTS